jgi:glycosyltransferase involved in cell wall biosynthesis
MISAMDCAPISRRLGQPAGLELRDAVRQGESGQPLAADESAKDAVAQVLVLAPSTSDNSLGRALCLAAILEHLGPVTVAAAEHGPMWLGAASWDISVDVYSGTRQLLGIAERELRTHPLPLVIVAVKPLPTSLGAAILVSRILGHRGRSVRLIADLDEDDLTLRWAALRHTPRRQRLRWHARTVRDLHVGHPLLVSLLQTRCAPRADAVTVSSWEVKRLVRRAQGPVLRVPHAREVRRYAPPLPADRLRLGFFGTPRGYKGVRVLASLLEVLPDTELHLLGDRLPGGFSIGGDVTDRVRFHAAGDRRSLDRAFAEVDVVVLPQDPAAEQTRLQLPAKLIDALMFGRPVVATATPPIVELGGPYVRTVASWAPLGDAIDALNGLRDRETRERMGRAANEYARRTLSTRGVAEQIRTVFGSIVDR